MVTWGFALKDIDECSRGACGGRGNCARGKDFSANEAAPSMRVKRGQVILGGLRMTLWVRGSNLELDMVKIGSIGENIREEDWSNVTLHDATVTVA